MRNRLLPEGIKQFIVGILSAVVAFFATLGLSTVYDERFFTLMVAAIAYSCWHVNWKSGAICAFTGMFGVVLLLPPKMHFSLASTSEFIRLIVFIFTGSMVCLLSYFNDRNVARLQAQRDRTARTEEWLQVAAQETKLWTWEYDPDRNLLSWQSLAANTRMRQVMPFESWLRRLHPTDRETVKNMLLSSSENTKLHLEYRIQTRKGVYWWSSRGVVLKQYGPGTRKYIGISTDITVQKSVSQTPMTVNVTEQSQLNMSQLMDIDSIIREVLDGTSLHATYRDRLTKALNQVEMLMVSDMSSNVKK